MVVVEAVAAALLPKVYKCDKVISRIHNREGTLGNMDLACKHSKLHGFVNSALPL